MYYSLWVALSRYDMVLCRELERQYRVTVEMVEHAKDIAVLSEVPVRELVEDLLVSHSYEEIAKLAGKIAFGEIVSWKQRLRREKPASAIQEALKLLSQLVPTAGFQVEKVGGGRVFRCRNSPFAVSGCGRMTCGFISGFVTAAMGWQGQPRLRAEESLCASVDSEVKYCLFELR